MLVKSFDNLVERYTGTFVDNDFREGSLESTPNPGQEAYYKVRSAGGTFAKSRLIQGWVKNHDGSSFKGSFRESGPEFHYKQGTYTSAKAKYQYTGEFLNNEFHGQGTVMSTFEPHDETTYEVYADNGEPCISAFCGIFEDGELIEGWIEFTNGDRFEGSCHGKYYPAIIKTFKHGKYQWNCGQCTYTGGSLTESFTWKVCCTTRIFTRTCPTQWRDHPFGSHLRRTL